MVYKNKEKILLILDVDETLIHASKEQLDREADFILFDYYVYKRPHLEEFLNTIKNEFLIAIWSSASDDYVHEVSRIIVPNGIDLEFVWGRSRCSYKRNLEIDEFGYYADDYLNHYNYIKPLKKVKRRGYQLERILIIDDTPHKSMDNFGNAVYPKEYKGEVDDDELLFLGKYLNRMKDLKNVRRIEKRNWKNKVE